jgi:hypothetical protein
VQVLELVEVAVRDSGKPAFCDPAEQLVAVEELPAVDERLELAPLE